MTRIGSNRLVISTATDAMVHIITLNSVAGCTPWQRWGNFPYNGTNDTLVRKISIATGGEQAPYDHAGGLQAFGKYAYVPVNDNNQSKVVAVDTDTAMIADSIYLPYFSPVPGSDTFPDFIGAVGVARRLDTSFVFVFAGDQSESKPSIQFHATNPSDTTVTAANALSKSAFLARWDNTVPVYNPDGTQHANAWQPDGQSYQNLTLVTQTDGRLFMVAMYRDSSDKDLADLYQIDFLGSPIAPPKSYCNALGDAGTACLTLVQKGQHFIIPSSDYYGNFVGGSSMYATPLGQLFVYSAARNQEISNWEHEYGASEF